MRGVCGWSIVRELRVKICCGRLGRYEFEVMRCGFTEWPRVDGVEMVACVVV
jgi:hypothetical protein